MAMRTTLMKGYRKAAFPHHHSDLVHTTIITFSKLILTSRTSFLQDPASSQHILSSIKLPNNPTAKMNTYTITIQNNSGVFKNYALFTGQPVVTGQVQPKIWSNVFCTAPCPAGNTATFTVYKQFFALMGTSSGSPQSGVTVTVSGTKNVTLGKLADDGSLTSGSSVNYITNDVGTPDAPMLVPSFAQDYLASGGQPNSFEIQTTGPFTPPDANQGNWLIGVGGSINGASGPAAMFAPVPNQSYQVKPINVFWVSTGQYVPGALVDYTMITKSALKLDFSTPSAKPTVTVNNTPEGKLVPLK
ncbi:hypothetical protein F4777DRAFT_576696 [Nemania sp. FL0916]|nr:hypothetical protein F4777DRAFT_576696 [Nemania sp. FL0916]